MAIINLWIANFNETAKCLLLSQGQTEAQDLLSKISFIYEKLPAHLRLTPWKDNRETFALKENHAEIKALPSTDKAGHGFQGSIVTRDEVARHEYARINYRAVARAVNSGGKLVELSTANKSDPNNYFTEKTEEFYRASGTYKKVLPSGVELYLNPYKPGVCLVFLSWKLRPVRDEGMTLQEWWDSRVLPRFTKLEIEEQFPTTIDDVFNPSLVKAYFDFQSLDDMSCDVQAPIKQSTIDTYNGIVRVYKLPDKSRKYVLFTDPSDGVEDPFVTGVMDYVTGEVVCSATGKERIDVVSAIHDYLVREYNNATNSFEGNAVGIAMDGCLSNLKTPNQAPRRRTDGKADPDKRGQFVSREHKKLIFADLASAVVKRQIVVHDREFMQQAKLVTRDDMGMPVTERKLTFDWVMMMNGLWQLQKFVPRGSFRIESYSLD
jgi:hypothetical protein